jgi:hypothetical protein
MQDYLQVKASSKITNHQPEQETYINKLEKLLHS